MEVAVGQPKAIFDLDVHIPFALQKRNCSDPVPLLDVVLQRGHLLLLNLAVLPLFSAGALHFGLGNRRPRTIHLILNNIKFKFIRQVTNIMQEHGPFASLLPWSNPLIMLL